MDLELSKHPIASDCIHPQMAEYIGVVSDPKCGAHLSLSVSPLVVTTVRIPGRDGTKLATERDFVGPLGTAASVHQKRFLNQ